MNDTKQKFNVKTEKGETKEAELISVFSKDDIEYAIYAIDNGNGTSDLYASRIIVDENGEDKLIDIEDAKEKEEIIALIKDMLNK